MNLFKWRKKRKKFPPSFLGEKLILCYCHDAIALRTPEDYFIKSGFDGLIIELRKEVFWESSPTALSNLLHSLSEKHRNLKIFIGIPCENLSGTTLCPWEDNDCWQIFFERISAVSDSVVLHKWEGVLFNAEIGEGTQKLPNSWGGESSLVRPEQLASVISPNITSGVYTFFPYHSKIISLFYEFWKSFFLNFKGQTMVFAEDTYWSTPNSALFETTTHYLNDENNNLGKVDGVCLGYLIDQEILDPKSEWDKGRRENAELTIAELLAGSTYGVFIFYHGVSGQPGFGTDPFKYSGMMNVPKIKALLDTARTKYKTRYAEAVTFNQKWADFISGIVKKKKNR